MYFELTVLTGPVTIRSVLLSVADINPRSGVEIDIQEGFIIKGLSDTSRSSIYKIKRKKERKKRKEGEKSRIK